MPQSRSHIFYLRFSNSQSFFGFLAYFVCIFRATQGEPKTHHWNRLGLGLNKVNRTGIIHS